MNPGNNKPNSTGLDNFVDRLNKRFGRLLGKNNRPIKPEETSNMTFSVIVLLACVLLWLCTGFYFLGENEYGLIFVNGRVVDVKHGIKVGMSLPYPFGDAEIIDGAPSKVMTIGANLANSFVVLDKNLSPVIITAKYTYQITNPKLLFLSHLQDQDEFDNEIMWQIMSKTNNFIANRDITELRTTNLTVLSNEIDKLIIPTLDSYGITITKFAILSLQEQNEQMIVPLPKSNSSGTENLSPRDFNRAVNRDRSGVDE